MKVNKESIENIIGRHHPPEIVSDLLKLFESSREWISAEQRPEKINETYLTYSDTLGISTQYFWGKDHKNGLDREWSIMGVKKWQHLPNKPKDEK